MDIETNRALQLATGRAFKAVVDGRMDNAVVHVLDMANLKGTGANTDGVHHWLIEACRIAGKPTPTRAEVVRILEGLKVRGLISMAAPGIN